MRHVNVAWPEREADEYARLFRECSDMTSEDVLEDDDRFEAMLNDYIDEHASDALKKWLTYLDKIKNQSA